MDQNEKTATNILEAYLLANKSMIKLDPIAKDILKEEIDEFPYYSYDLSEIKLKLKKAGVEIQKLPKCNWEKILNEKHPANYIRGFKMIIIQKQIVKTEFLMCEFVHEFGHYKFHMGKWTKDNYKSHNPHTVPEDEEEYTCKLLGIAYAMKKGFGEKYIQLIVN